jgi:hypothetical protein
MWTLLKSMILPTPSPSTPFLEVHASEIGQENFVKYESNKGICVRVRFKRLIGVRMDPYLAEASTGAGQLVASKWLSACKDRQRARYPTSPNTLDEIRHFYFVGHDTTVEVLAEDFFIEEFRPSSDVSS